MIIDAHAHLVPQSWFSPSSPPAIFDIPGLLKAQDEAQVDMTLFGNNWIRTPADRSPFDIVVEFNEFAAETTQRYPDRLQGLACTVPFGDERFLKEAERAVLEYGLKGIMVNSSVDGEYLDSPNAVPFFELVASLDVPLFVHPPRVTIGAERMEIFRLPEMVGRPFDTTLSMARFILSGGFEKFPKLKIVCAHVGGVLPMLPGRLDFGYELRKDRSFGAWEPDVLSQPPSSYIEQLYYDTVSLHSPAVYCAVQTAGADHVLFGSDFPPVPIPLQRSVDTIRDLPVAEGEQEQILGGNAARLLGLRQ